MEYLLNKYEQGIFEGTFHNRKGRKLQFRKMKQKIPYGVANFKVMREEGLYYVDKTSYISKLEGHSRFIIFVRPRRFGKSLFVDTLRCYYDLNEKANFSVLFGGLAAGEAPTENANRYLVLVLDFSMISAGAGQTLEQKFDGYLSRRLDDFLFRYSSLLGEAFVLRQQVEPANGKFVAIVSRLKALGLQLYLIIDEYDNFTNEMLEAPFVSDYKSITHGTGFYRNWFKAFKGSCDRIFMTGVLPITIDDLTSGFNIAANVSHNPAFNAMLGFSEAEVVQMYEDFKGTGEFIDGESQAIVRSIKPFYDGYCFSKGKIGKESVFNSDMVLFYLKSLVTDGCPPASMIDVNISMDYDKLQSLAGMQHDSSREQTTEVLPIVETLATTGQMSFELVDSFSAEKMAEGANLKSLFFYYGILSMSAWQEGQVVYNVPNACVKKQLFDYICNAYRRAAALDLNEWGTQASAFAYRGEWRPFLERLARDYADTTPVRGGIQGEIRIQGFMQAEFGQLKYYLMAPELELKRGFADFALFPERVYYGDCKHSYLIELKFAASQATQEELSEQYAEAKCQLARYRSDRMVPSLSKGTMLHQIVFQFKGVDCIRLEEIAVEKM